MNSAINLQQTSSSIPEEIIVFEILKRLPAKTLYRFKAVSKRWLSIITTSRPFLDSHFKHSKLNPKCLFSFTIKGATATTDPTTFLYDPQSQTLQSHKWDKYYPRFSISPRGLICLYGSSDPTVQIWNPSTGERTEVSFPPYKQLPTISYFSLGFDLISKKHKLLSYGNGENYVLTLGDNQKWRKIIRSSSRNVTYINLSHCSIDGIVYYLARCDQNDDEVVLLAFDVGSESFLETIPVPGELVLVHNDCNYFTAEIRVYRGRVLLLNYDSRKLVMKMWVLEDVEKQKWSPMRIIPPPPPSLKRYKVGNIDGEELIYYSSTLLDANSEGFRLCRYNLENGRWKETLFPNLSEKLDGSATYVVMLYYYIDDLESIKTRTLSIVEKNMEKEEKMMKKKRRRATISFLESLKLGFGIFRRRRITQICSSFFHRK